MKTMCSSPLCALINKIVVFAFLTLPHKVKSKTNWKEIAEFCALFKKCLLIIWYTGYLPALIHCWIQGDTKTLYKAWNMTVYHASLMHEHRPGQSCFFERFSCISNRYLVIQPCLTCCHSHLSCDGWSLSEGLLKKTTTHCSVLFYYYFILSLPVHSTLSLFQKDALKKGYATTHWVPVDSYSGWSHFSMITVLVSLPVHHSIWWGALMDFISWEI